ncbi:MAG: TraR/DksA family transcriptional regulator [Gammaproteobacteria bacterium]|jgi:DnaK suppressor protein|nr:TraR/DksA family transcriptional regulator [Gammaproteobacteria bacterium]MBT5441337.1 TraR/DksA family transcriptional regulator [Gammaproteobacteria bacterium]MDG1233572.1 TraR/DksA family transcriptional regulator [Pseudomonadales bacterium]
MPALTKNQRAMLQTMLEQLEEELKDLLSITEAGAKPVKLKDNQGRLSRMDELHNQSILIANRTVTSNRLKAVQQAKQRLELESYGFCTSCEEPIAFKRLEAYPEASMCIKCQSDNE